MLTNNAENEVQEQADVEDTSSTTETNAIEADETASEQTQVDDGEQVTESELFYEIDGEEVSASTVAEWKKGHMMQADYTKKTQATAELKKSLEGKHQEVEGVKTKLNDVITELEAVIQKESNPEALAELRDTDPSEYLRKKEEIAERQKLADKAKQELADIKAKQEKDRIAEEQGKLLEAMTDWQDPKKQEADLALMDDYVKTAEFTEHDVNALSSHKLMIMALDAAKYHKLKKEVEETGKQVEKAPNVIKAKPKQKTKATSLTERFYGKQ